MTPQLACIGEPISWLRLETFARDRKDLAIRAHLGACPACQACLDEIERDVVALPPLVVPTAKPSPWKRWLPRLVPAFALATAAMIALVLWRGGDAGLPTREDVVSVKGVGEVILGVARERGGVVRTDTRSFATGDRFKVIVTCPPAASALVEVAVTEVATGSVDRPLAPARIACGNQIAVPGAFSLTGGTHRVCARISDGTSAAGTACLTLAPE
jgi:hypothetical protein